jgi:hypothetical protein
LQKDNIHFIVGIWRSGTTLLREVLGMNPDVKIFPEHFLLLHQLTKHPKFDQKLIDDTKNQLLTNPDFFHFAKPNLSSLDNELDQCKSFNELFLTIYKSCLKGDEVATTFIDKNPIYSYYLPQLIQKFPEAKFIWMLREPKDNSISRATHDIQSIKNYGYLATWWNITNEAIAKSAIQYPDKFLLVPYDKMVENPRPYLEEMCTFLNIDYLPQMLSFEKKKDKRLTEFVIAAKARHGKITEDYAKRKEAMWENLQKPINTSKTKQWEHKLSPKEITQIDSLSKDYYNALINGDYKNKPDKNLIYNSLAQFSLAKLKLEIKSRTKT